MRMFTCLLPATEGLNGAAWQEKDCILECLGQQRRTSKTRLGFSKTITVGEIYTVRLVPIAS